MATKSNPLLADVEEFLNASGMSPTYFGKRATGNSELVKRLRQNGRVWPETARRVRRFIRERSAASDGHVAAGVNLQELPPKQTGLPRQPPN